MFILCFHWNYTRTKRVLSCWTLHENIVRVLSLTSVYDFNQWANAPTYHTWDTVIKEIHSNNKLAGRSHPFAGMCYFTRDYRTQTSQFRVMDAKLTQSSQVDSNVPQKLNACIVQSTARRITWLCMENAWITRTPNWLIDLFLAFEWKTHTKYPNDTGVVACSNQNTDYVS